LVEKAGIQVRHPFWEKSGFVDRVFMYYSTDLIRVVVG
jgi:hypothetical protein